MSSITIELDEGIRLLEPHEKVVFRRTTEGDIVALFPETPVDQEPDHCLAYNSYRGFYSTDYLRAVKHSKTAKPREYGALFSELTSLGADLEVGYRAKPESHQRRLERMGIHGAEAKREASALSRAEEKAEEGENDTGRKAGRSPVKRPIPVAPIKRRDGKPAEPTPVAEQKVTRPERKNEFRADNGINVHVSHVVDLEFTCQTCGRTQTILHVDRELQFGCSMCGAPYKVRNSVPYVEMVK